MAVQHGTRRRYVGGCRCGDCTEANRLYFRERRAGVAGGQPPQTVADLPPSEPGPVEAGVQAEISDLAAEARPGLAQAALAWPGSWITRRL
jgi:hypothetical protein